MKKTEVKKDKLRRIAKRVFRSFKELAEICEPAMVPHIMARHQKKEDKNE